MYFCDDVDLAVWEPGVFGEGAFGHQAVVKEVSGTLTGTGLVTGAGGLDGVLAGMVGTIVAGTVSQLVEIVAVADSAHGTVSGIKGREGEGAIGPAVGGSVKVTVVSFRPQIGVVGDGLLGLLGVASDRGAEAAVAVGELTGFRTAAVFGTLAAIYRGAAGATNGTNVVLSKASLYETLAKGARRGVEGLVDEDGDGVAERRVRAGVGRVVRG